MKLKEKEWFKNWTDNTKKLGKKSWLELIGGAILSAGAIWLVENACYHRGIADNAKGTQDVIGEWEEQKDKEKTDEDSEE